jgi:VanZ family protein
MASVRRSARIGAWAAVALWAGLIFGLSSIPSLSTGLGTWDLVLRKCAHMTEYAILAVLLARATRRPVPAFVLAVLYAASDELHQHFVRGRHASPVDVAIDAVGALAGLVLYARVPFLAWNARTSPTGSSTPSSSGSTASSRRSSG